MHEITQINSEKENIQSKNTSISKQDPLHSNTEHLSNNLQDQIGNYFNTRISPNFSINKHNDKYEKQANYLAQLASKSLDGKQTTPNVIHNYKPEITLIGNTTGTSILKHKGNGNTQLYHFDSTQGLSTRNKHSSVNNITSSAIPKINSFLDKPSNKGKRLNSNTRKYFERFFNSNLNEVRIHHYPQANYIASQLNAKAFTVNKNITFNSGQYSPYTKEGIALLAHELTHVEHQKCIPGNVAPLIQRTPNTDNSSLSSRMPQASRYPREIANDSIENLRKTIINVNDALKKRFTENLHPFFALIALDKSSSFVASKSFITDATVNMMANLFDLSTETVIRHMGKKTASRVVRGTINNTLKKAIQRGITFLTPIMGFLAGGLVGMFVGNIWDMLFGDKKGGYSLRRDGAMTALVKYQKVLNRVEENHIKKRKIMLQVPAELSSRLSELTDSETAEAEAINKIATRLDKNLSLKKSKRDMSLYKRMLRRWILSNAGDHKTPNKYVDKSVWNDVLLAAWNSSKFKDKLRKKGYSGPEIPSIKDLVSVENRNFYLINKRDLFIYQCMNMWGLMGFNYTMDANVSRMRELLSLHKKSDIESLKQKIENEAFRLHSSDNPSTFYEIAKKEDTDQNYENHTIYPAILYNKFYTTCKLDLYDDKGSIYVHKFHFTLDFDLYKQEEQDWKDLSNKLSEAEAIEANKKEDTSKVYHKYPSPNPSDYIEEELNSVSELRKRWDNTPLPGPPLPWYKTKFWIKPK